MPISFILVVNFIIYMINEIILIIRIISLYVQIKDCSYIQKKFSEK